MRPNLITRLKEEWNNLDPVDPLRGLIADAIDALVEAQLSKPLPEYYTVMEQALTRLQKRYAELEGKASKPLTRDELRHMYQNSSAWQFYCDIDARLFGRPAKAAEIGKEKK